MLIVKAAPGLDPHNYLAQCLGPGDSVVTPDFARPLAGQVSEADVLLTRDVAITREVIDAAPCLKLIQRYGHHVVGVDIAYAAQRGIPVARVPSSASKSNIVVAEHAFFLMMAAAKRLRESDAALRAGRLGSPETVLISGKTLALIGVGGTGAELARMARGFNMKVLAAKRDTRNLDGAQAHIDVVVPLNEMRDILAAADFVSLHLPLNDATRDSIGAPFFEAMQRHAWFINIARGEIVQKTALFEALAADTIAGAAVDVFWDEGRFDGQPFLDNPKLIATPHIAGASVDCLRALAQAAAVNIERVRRGGQPLNIVRE